jgi:hypothetical protein
MFVFTTERKNVVPAKPARPSGPGSASAEPHPEAPRDGEGTGGETGS